MDLRLFCAVLWRFKRLIIGGFLLAVVLAVVAYGTPGFSHGKPDITPRGSVTWQSQTELLITESSFPYGRAAPELTGGSAKTGAPAEPLGDQDYMSGLAPIYAALANGNNLQTLIHKNAPVGTLNATEVTDAATNGDLPFVELTATAPTSRAASRLSGAAASVLVNYVTKQQNAAGISATDRVQLQLVDNGAGPKLIEGHKLSIPLLVFVAVMGAAIALAFILENARPGTAVELGRVPGPPGQDSLAPNPAVSLNPGAAVVRLDHLLAGVRAPDSEFDEHPDSPITEDPVVISDEHPGTFNDDLDGDADGALDIDGEEHATSNGDEALTWPKQDRQSDGVTAANSLWEASQKAVQQGVPFRPDSGD
jgi:hypothetical protein